MAYQFKDIPVDFGPREVREWMTEQLREITASFQGIEFIQLPELNVEPAKPRTGMIALADGTNWDPDATGNGGFFGYYGGSWVKLG